MIRLGAPQTEMSEMNENQVFLTRLQLMIIMVKSALNDYPIGEFRKKAIIENAETIHDMVGNIDLTFMNQQTSSHILRLRIKLLCVMATAAVYESYPKGSYRWKAVMENVDEIISAVFSDKQFQILDEILNVA